MQLQTGDIEISSCIQIELRLKQYRDQTLDIIEIIIE